MCGAAFAQQETATKPAEAAEKQSLLTKVYEVAPSFPDWVKGERGDSGGGAADHFADPVRDETTGQIKLETVQEGLGYAGIVFEDGASATYDKKKSRLTVTNTSDQIKLVEVDPVLGADNFTIDLNLSPENVKLEAIEQ